MTRLSLLRRALVALPLLAVLATGCATEDVGRSSYRVPSVASAGGRNVGVFLGGQTDIATHEAWVGSRVSYVGGYVPKTTWSAFDRASFRQWTGKGRTLVVGVPMLMTQQGGSLGAGANGAYDSHFRSLANRLVAEGHPRALLRLGWEFNGDWYPWRADRDPQAFASYWRRIVTTMRSVPGGAGLRFDWNPGHGPGFVPEAAYPGDAYVDVVSFDVYDRTWSNRFVDPAARWRDYLARPYGLNWLRDFARAHGKPMGFPEWGVTRNHVGGVRHDNPTFIRGMADFIRTNNVEYHNYFNVRAHDGDFRLLNFPESARAYQQAF
ncbi:hypothetical protein BH18ACT1_BH18ACT1_02330 [soil metagenome]|nr:hypothetical protein [Acidimicrobiia bacterium]